MLGGIQVGTLFQEHKRRWEKCRLCSLSGTRRNVVLVRGTLPCDVLLIGEAPGTTEDLWGIPFCGPAGNLLQRLIQESGTGNVRYALTNVIACIPKSGESDQKTEVDKKHIEACSRRLREIYLLASPKFVVYVGALSEKYVPILLRDLRNWNSIKKVKIAHPSGILRIQDPSQRDLVIKRVLVTLSDIVEEITNPVIDVR